MTKQRIIVSKKVPHECLAPYEADFDFTLPEDGDRLSYEYILERIAEFDGFFAIDAKVDKRVLDAAKKLKAVANFGVGYDRIDWKYATELGIPVLNTPTTVTEATAEFTIALIMAVMRGIPRYNNQVRQNIWDAPLFSDVNTMVGVSTLGIIGLGRIGKSVCRKAQGLGMKVVYYDKFRASEEIEKEYNVVYKPFDEILAQSDCIAVHVPYLPENNHMFNAETFAKMKPSAYFVNTARGKLMDEAALCRALKNGVIKGAALDVFEQEPKVYEELLSLDNVVLTPHVASLTMHSRMAMCDEALSGLTSVLKGRIPRNVVNPTVFGK
ncbi:MAG TPA: 3-phosphoglycerate dehydrogenase [Ruminiclostridium sp.]|nr:3-phosphoglycerate dehydrogenase [Ruminiclostridium sp.]